MPHSTHSPPSVSIFIHGAGEASVFASNGSKPSTGSHIKAGPIVGSVFIGIAFLVCLRIMIVWLRVWRGLKKEKSLARSGPDDLESMEWASKTDGGSVLVLDREIQQREATAARGGDDPCGSGPIAFGHHTSSSNASVNPEIQTAAAQITEEDLQDAIEVEDEDDGGDEGSGQSEDEVEVVCEAEGQGQETQAQEGRREPEGSHVLQSQARAGEETANTAQEPTDPVQPATPAVETRSISDRSMATVLSDPPPPYSADDPFDVDKLRLSRVTPARRSIVEPK